MSDGLLPASASTRESRPLSATQQAVLRALGGNRSFVSGQELGASLAVSRAAVAKAVDGLRTLGYDITSSPHRGHRLDGRPDMLTSVEVADGLRTRALGRELHHFATLPSTQPVARRLAESGSPHGMLVVAEEQTGGRGRLGRPYLCPPGGVWATLVLRGQVPMARASLVGLAAGIALARAIGEIAGLVATLKWPNDVIVGGRKVAGVLTELAAEEQAVHYFLVGTGINVNLRPGQFPAELQPIATSLRIERGQPVSRRDLLQAYLARFEELFDQLLGGEFEAVVEAWRALPNSLGRCVRARMWDREIVGVARDLGDDGSLCIDTGADELSRVRTGDIVHLSEAVEP